MTIKAKPEKTGTKKVKRRRITTIYVRTNSDPEAISLLKDLKSQGYLLDDLRIEHVYRVEGTAQASDLLPMFANPLYQMFDRKTMLTDNEGPIVEIGYQRAVTDPEKHSALDGAKALGIEGVDWVRLSKRYQFIGATPAEAERIAREQLYNPIIQAVIDPAKPWESLKPSGKPDPIRRISLKGMTGKRLIKLSEDNSWYAPLSQLKALQAYEHKIGRPLTDAEIEITVQSWSDHCYHTTWRGLGLLEKLQAATARINHPLVVSVFHDNAGAMRLGPNGDQVVLIKGETHNFPSAIATFGGVATKHGGVIRDAIGFGRGGYPIGGSTIMGTMDPRTAMADVPKGALHPRKILVESIQATGYYCNPMGIPMMKPAYYIHPGFPKCLALGHTLGIIPYMYALKEDPKPGDKVVLFGGLTGRDGVHGATASSAAMTSETLTKDKAAVQIGLPIIERKFMTAVPEWRDRSCLRSITDLGAGGISCAVGELGKRGVKIHSDRVPLKDSSLSPWEILLSESQERMLAAVPPEKIDEFIEIAEKYDIQYTILGEFNDSGKYSVFHGDEQFVDLDMNFLWKQCPIDNVIVEPAIRPYVELNIDEPTTADEWRAAAIELLRHWHCCDQSAAGTQFDSTVQGQTVVGPYGGAHGDMPTGATVLAPLEDAFDGVAFSIAYHPYYGDLDPAGMARLAVIEAIAKLISAGVPLSQIGLCDNFYAPKIRPDVAADLVGVVDVICEASEVFGTPFISGKDSSSGTFKADDGTLIDVPFSLVVAGMGILPDVRKTVTSEFKEAGNQLIYVGACWPNKRFLGASTYAVMEDKKGGRLPRDGTLSEHKTTFEAIHELMERGLVRSASAMTSGGIWASIFKSCLGSDLGAELTLNQISDQLSAPLFGEAPGGFILEFDQKTDAKVLMGLDWCEIGTVTQDPVVRVLWRGEEKFQATVEELAKEWRQPFAEVIG